MPEWTARLSNLLMIAVTLIIALTAVENWRYGNLPAAIAGAGWAITLLVLYVVTAVELDAKHQEGEE